MKVVLPLLGVVIMLGASVFAVLYPVEPTMPVYLELAGRLRSGPIFPSFEPLGYAWLISLVPVHDVVASAKLLHLISYWCLGGAVVLFGLASLRRIHTDTGGANLRSSLIVVLCVLLLAHPYVIVNLVRINDNNVAVAAVFGLFALISGGLTGVSSRSRWLQLIGTGSLLGFLLHIRPNAISLLPLLAFDAYRRTRSLPQPARQFAARSSVSLAAVAAVYCLLAVVMAGRPFFWPTNGPYNAFAGNNPASLGVLKTDYNAEASLDQGLRSCGIGASARSVDGRTLVECAARFAVRHPQQLGALVAYKFYNLMFRPNLRLSDSLAQALLQGLLVGLPIFWWTCNLWTLVRTGEVFDCTATLFVLLYALPFALTNSDPRFRLPLDAVYVASFVFYLGRLGQGGPTFGMRA